MDIGIMEFHEQNRKSWNEATRAHLSHQIDQVNFFLSDGSTLYTEEKDLLGDLTGKSILHLQCNTGYDTLSIKRLGAANVTGVDISDVAIDFAKKLSSETGISSEFARADVYDWLAQTDPKWDVVFCSYGAICWLSDIQKWAQGVKNVLKSGGRFVAIDYHPVASMFDENLVRRFSYSTYGKPVEGDDGGVDDYVGMAGPAGSRFKWQQGIKDFKNPEIVHEFVWSLSEILGSLAGAGLHISHFREYPYSNGFKFFKEMNQLTGRRWSLPQNSPQIPLMFSVIANR